MNSLDSKNGKSPGKRFSSHQKGLLMTSVKTSYLGVNVLYWVVAALLHPLASLLPTGSGEPPKIFTLLIPLAFVGLAFGSTLLMARGMMPQKES